MFAEFGELHYNILMKIDYLTWYKNLEKALHNAPKSYQLQSSAVAEPLELMRKDLESFAADFEHLMKVPNSWGHPALIESIGDRYRLAPENIAPTIGVSNGIYLTCRALLEPGDSAIIESPGYEPLVAAADFIGAKIDFIKRRPFDYAIDPDELADKISSSTKLIIISNLHNPSGAFIGNEQLLDLLEAAQSRNPHIKIIVDEVYRDLVPDIGPPAAALDDTFISLNSLTKVYGLGALHCGWIIADSETISRIRQLQVLVEGSGVRLIEALSAFIIENLEKYLNRSLEILSQNRAIARQLVEPLINSDIIKGDIPTHGCVYFPKIGGVPDSEQLTDFLAKQHNLFVVPGRFFGEPSHIRIGLGGETKKFESSLQLFANSITHFMK